MELQLRLSSSASIFISATANDLEYEAGAEIFPLSGKLPGLSDMSSLFLLAAALTITPLSENLFKISDQSAEDASEPNDTAEPVKERFITSISIA